MIINYLKHNIIGGFGDQVGGFILQPDQKLVGAPFNTSVPSLWESNQPVFSLIYGGGSQFIDPVLFSNLFSLLSILSLFIFSFLLFRCLKINKFVGLILSLILTFSPYTYLHLGVHPALMQVWMIPVFVILLLRLYQNSKVRTLKQGIVAGVFLAITILISNYLGYFLMLFAGVFAIAAIVVKLVFKEFSWGWLKSTAIKNAIIFGTCLLISIPAILPYFKSSYGGPSVGGIGVSRSLEDFQNFSGRPWYLFLPPVQNPVFGNITKSVLDWMKNGWGYYLADDYFNSESPEMFLGWGSTAILIIALIFNFKFLIFNQFLNREKAQNLKNENIVNTLIFLLTLSLLFLFTLPPVFDFAGVRVYTPGFLLYKLFPMFRVTQRLGVIILLCVLVVNGIFLSRMSKIKCQISNQTKMSKLKCFFINHFNVILATYLVFTLVEFFVPVRITNVEKVPPVYEYLSKIDDPKVIIATYPSQSPEDIFWISRHHKGLINARDFVYPEYQFDSKEFTKQLSTIDGLLEAKKYGVDYLVFDRTGFPDSQKSADSEKFFRNNLTPEKDFNGTLLFKL